MSKPYILNIYERAALLALSKHKQIPAHSDANPGFGRAHLDALLGLGLAAVVPSQTDPKRNDFRISDDGWRCMFGLSKAQIDGDADRAPAPFRVWQWPLPAAFKKAA
ncbi:hypothetical protein [Devosia sp. A449]